MRRVLAAIVALSAGFILLLTPNALGAGPVHAGVHAFVAVHSGHFGHPRVVAFPHHRFVHHPFFFPRHHFFVGVGVVPFAFGGFAPPVVVQASPSVVYAAPPAVYSTSVTAAPPQPPATSRVIVYPNGRYELYGDGVSTPYVWVWIPNAPPPPPPPAPPS